MGVAGAACSVLLAAASASGTRRERMGQKVRRGASAGVKFAKSRRAGLASPVSFSSFEQAFIYLGLHVPSAYIPVCPNTLCAAQLIPRPFRLSPGGATICDNNNLLRLFGGPTARKAPAGRPASVGHTDSGDRRRGDAQWARAPPSPEAGISSHILRVRRARRMAARLTAVPLRGSARGQRRRRPSSRPHQTWASSQRCAAARHSAACSWPSCPARQGIVIVVAMRARARARATTPDRAAPLPYPLTHSFLHYNRCMSCSRRSRSSPPTRCSRCQTQPRCCRCTSAWTPSGGLTLGRFNTSRRCPGFTVGWLAARACRSHGCR